MFLQQKKKRPRCGPGSYSHITMWLLHTAQVFCQINPTKLITWNVWIFLRSAARSCCKCGQMQFSRIGLCKDMSLKNDFAMFINHVVIIRRRADDVSLRWTTGWILHAFGTKEKVLHKQQSAAVTQEESQCYRHTACPINSVGCYLCLFKKISEEEDHTTEPF